MIHEKVKWLLVWFSFPIELHWSHSILHTWIFFSLHGLPRKIAFSDILYIVLGVCRFKNGDCMILGFSPKTRYSTEKKIVNFKLSNRTILIEGGMQLFSMFKHWICFYLYLQCIFFKVEKINRFIVLRFIISNLEFCCELIRNMDIL